MNRVLWMLVNCVLFIILGTVVRILLKINKIHKETGWDKYFIWYYMFLHGYSKEQVAGFEKTVDLIEKSSRASFNPELKEKFPSNYDDTFDIPYEDCCPKKCDRWGRTCRSAISLIFHHPQWCDNYEIR